MLALPREELEARVRAMQEGRKAALRRRPRRLAEVEARMDELAVEYRTRVEDRPAIRRELRELGQERIRLRWADA